MTSRKQAVRNHPFSQSISELQNQVEILKKVSKFKYMHDFLIILTPNKNCIFPCTDLDTRIPYTL